MGPTDYWPKKSGKNVRDFTDEQRRAGEAVIGLQAGSNKGASQAGMSMGKQRMIYRLESYYGERRSFQPIGCKFEK